MKPSQEKQQEIKRIYEENLADKITSNYVPFFARYGEKYEVDNGILFVGKAENMADKNQKNVNEKIDSAYEKIHNDDYIETISKTNPYPKSPYVRTLQKIAKKVEQKHGITHFARTNLYKLSTTNTHVFNSEYEKAYVDIFRKEIELLRPKYVIMLTSGKENNFLKNLGKQEKCEKVEFNKKNLKCIKIDGFDSLFITALHPQGKPEDKLVEAIVGLINTTIHKS